MATSEQKIRSTITFRTGVAGARFIIGVSAAMDALDPSEPYSRVYFLDERTPQRWGVNEHDFVIPSLCVWRDPDAPERRCFVALSEDGHVVFLYPQQIHEQISGAGLHNATAQGLGYLNDIQQIGGHLYACGYSGQVYRRRGADDWEHLDHGLLQKPDVDGPRYFPEAINGPHERAIYIAGSEDGRGYPPRADFWDGNVWCRLELPATTGRLTNIFVESEERIWLCGSKGTLLLGNARDGFAMMSPLGARHLILSVTKYRDLYYLGTNLGLFQLDLTLPNRVFRQVRTSLDPDLGDANIVQVVDDVLWSIGPKDVARFDGANWERFPHPDNLPASPPAATP